jgi:hypothetical protein
MPKDSSSNDDGAQTVPPSPNHINESLSQKSSPPAVGPTESSSNDHGHRDVQAAKRNESSFLGNPADWPAVQVIDEKIALPSTANATGDSSTPNTRVDTLESAVIVPYKIGKVHPDRIRNIVEENELWRIDARLSKALDVVIPQLRVKLPEVQAIRFSQVYYRPSDNERVGRVAAPNAPLEKVV